MNIIRQLALTLVFFSSPLLAAGEPLVVGIISFAPPFLMQSGNKEVYGFSIDMMNNLCKIMERTCQYKIMKFKQLFPALTNKTIDVALASIVITPERASLVSFSLPYFVSTSRFLGKKSPDSSPFNWALFDNKRIGLESETVFADEINFLKIKDPIIKSYPQTVDVLEALSTGKVDYILVDNPGAIYWTANSANAFETIGPPFNYGYGYGMAVNPANKTLLASLNKALLQYQESEDYKRSYEKYFSPL